MDAGTLRFEALFPELEAGCCPNRVYVVMFDQDGNALKPNGLGTYTFQPYTKATHSSFAIVLAEHGERSKFYSSELSPVNHSVPVTPDGECYYLEFWKREGNTAYNRDEDEVLECRRVFWTGNYLSTTRLSDGDVEAVAAYKAELGVTYDSETSTVYFVAFLERNGELVTDPQQMEINWKARDNSTIANVVQRTTMNNLPGVYAFSLSLMDLDPDQATPITVTITDADGVEHTSGSVSLTWD